MPAGACTGCGPRRDGGRRVADPERLRVVDQRFEQREGVDDLDPLPVVAECGDLIIELAVEGDRAAACGTGVVGVAAVSRDRPEVRQRKEQEVARPGAPEAVGDVADLLGRPPSDAANPAVARGVEEVVAADEDRDQRPVAATVVVDHPVTRRLPREIGDVEEVAERLGVAPSVDAGGQVGVAERVPHPVRPDRAVGEAPLVVGRARRLAAATPAPEVADVAQAVAEHVEARVVDSRRPGRQSAAQAESQGRCPHQPHHPAPSSAS